MDDDWEYTATVREVQKTPQWRSRRIVMRETCGYCRTRFKFIVDAAWVRHEAYCSTACNDAAQVERALLTMQDEETAESIDADDNAKREGH